VFFPDHAAAEGNALADVDVVVHDRAVQEGAFLDHHVVADHAEFAQLRARLDLGVLPDAQRPGQDGLGVHLGPGRDPDAG